MIFFFWQDVEPFSAWSSVPYNIITVNTNHTYVSRNLFKYNYWLDHIEIKYLKKCTICFVFNIINSIAIFKQNDKLQICLCICSSTFLFFLSYVDMVLIRCNCAGISGGGDIKWAWLEIGFMYSYCRWYQKCW